MTRNFLRALPLIALAASPAACVTQQSILADAHPAIASEAGRINAPEAWTFGPKEDAVVVSAWSELIPDAALNALIDEAMRNSPSLRASAESVNRAQAFLRQAQASRLPSLSASLGANGGAPLEDGSFSESYSAGLSASWEADLWGDIRADLLATQFDVLNAHSVYRSARDALAASVARSYIGAIEARRITGLTEATLSAQEETLRIVRTRYNLGAASRRELVLSESDVASARDNLEVARANETTTIMALQILLGRYPDGRLDIAADLPDHAETLYAGTPEALLQQRPDVLSSEFAALAAFAAKRSAETARWPSLSLSAGLSSGALEIGDIFVPANMAYSLGARLAASLFDGGLSRARLDAATASQRQAVANYGQTVLNAYFDVETALQAIDTLQTRTPYIETSAEAARETLRLAEVQYKEGAIDLLDVLTFRQRSFSADRSLISLERQQIEARIALYMALGGTPTTE